ncbi:MAG: HDOD domain-containing protein [Deltaproteobacteria bacterium]|nr:HDOD domain-containing protein [Deltaproteobacteria bacterium]
MATAQQLLKRFNDMKTLPHVAIRLSKLISDEKSTMQEFEEVIRLDPTLVLRLLRVANSPYYGVKQKVDSIARAVVFIGMKNLRNMVVTEALKDIFKGGTQEDIFSRNQLWLHCAATSICGKMISERIFGQKGEDVFLCGILHDVGMIVEDQTAKDVFIQTCKAYEPNSKQITAYEREIIGTDHSEIGDILAYDWKMSPEVQEGIKHHHRSLNEVSPSSIAGITQMAVYIVSQLNYAAMPGMKGILSPPLATHIRDNLKEYKALARDLPDEMSKARELYEVQGE